MSENTTTKETPKPEAETPEAGADVMEALSKEIEAGVEAASAELLSDAPFSAEEIAESERAAEAAMPSGEGGTDDAGQAEADPDPAANEEAQADAPKAGTFDDLPDEIVARAVMAGIPLSEIKQYPSETLLNAMCARIEGQAGTGSQSDAGTSGSEGDTATADALSEIPDLDPAEFDPELVSAFKNMKGFIRQQHEDNESLRKTIEEMRGDQTKSWFDTRLDTVKKFTKGDAAKSASVREKFDALKAGYKATGKSVTDGAVFDEAAKMVLGSDMLAAKQKKKTDATRSRQGQFMARADGNYVQGKPGSVRDEVAAELNKAFSL